VSLIPWNSLESRASRIRDPIERLRYLRSRTRHIPKEIPPVTQRPRKKMPLACLAVLLTCLAIPGYQASSPGERTAAQPIPHFAAAAADVFPNVWVVEKTPEFEIYSNGLRIDDRYAVSNSDRLFYPVYQRSAIDPDQPEWRTAPAGIVYHTTESDQADFEADQNGQLKRIGKDVLNFVRRRRLYHFVIDRFGQVFRAVEESDVANHAGYSVWADDKVVYVNLNHSFLGIAFETQTQRGQDLPSANPAQIRAARTLTEMLRSKYHIPSSNCVTHAQVSVNPANMLIGYHTDWAGNFPFMEVGLSDNYIAPPASISTFGFDYDPVFVHATGVRIWQGLALAEDEVRAEAISGGLTVPQYRAILQKKYKQIIETLKAASADKETDHAT
jgi:N-acetylmuramoyl-L-alanine amidase